MESFGAGSLLLHHKKTPLLTQRLAALYDAKGLSINPPLFLIPPALFFVKTDGRNSVSLLFRFRYLLLSVSSFVSAPVEYDGAFSGGARVLPPQVGRPLRSQNFSFSVGMYGSVVAVVVFIVLMTVNGFP